jgi:small-conductance mechanosensitive channel
VLAHTFLCPPAGKIPQDAANYRIVPVSDEGASFWYRRLALLVGWFAFGAATIAVIDTLGITAISRQVVAYLLGLVLLGIALEAMWRVPSASPAPVGKVILTPRMSKILVSGLLILLWLSWFASAMNLFWLLAVICVSPFAIRLAQRSVNHALRKAGDATAGTEPPSVTAAVIERGVRAMLLVGGLLLLAQGWNLDLGEITRNESFEMRLARGIFSAAVILLVADFLWQMLKTVIDIKIVQSQDVKDASVEEQRRRARIRTLLPITRNILMVTIGVVALLMTLASLGVEIGPLIAGAGVVGVAVGFGAQTLVKDVIAGMFYLLDDAFRVGEYIQSGSHQGTVESFSIRSVKLRSPRGALNTVPFGQLGAVENMSRDWAIDKYSIGITYDSNIVLAKKLIRQIGQELMKDPELAPDIIEPLKMQGVDAFSDNAVKIRIKITTKPGMQTSVRRAALFLIKKAFDENGIKFAFPTVRVTGNEDPQAAAAQQLRLADEALKGAA